jgi:hypothetical protein
VSVNQIAILDETNYAKFYSRSHDAVIRVYDEAGNVIETHEQAGVQRLVARLSVFRLNSASYMPNNSAQFSPCSLFTALRLEEQK